MTVFAGLYFSSNGLSKSIPLKSVHIDARILDSVSVTTIVQKYENDSSDLLEAVYKFPIIANAAICAFEVEMNGRIQKGVVEEKKKAEKQYEDTIKNTTNQASLLTQTAGDVFQLNVGNIPPKTAVTIKITYTNELPTSSVGPNELVYTVPTTVAPRYGTPPPTTSTVVQSGDPAYFSSAADQYAYTLSMSLDVTMSTKVVSVSSDSHSIKFVPNTSNPKKAMVEFAGRDVKLDKDVVLTIASEKLDSPVAVVEIDDANQSKCVMLTMVPRFKLKEIQNPEFIFVIDRSGSMGGGSIQNASAALALFLRSLPPECTFNIVSFGSSYTPHFSLPAVAYSPLYLQQALEICSNMGADFGGTEIYNCLCGIFASWNNTTDAPKKKRQVFLLTDGEVHNTDAVLECVRAEHEKNGTRVFTLGIGDSVSRQLVDGVARVGRGDAQYIGSNERMEKKVIALLKKALQPSMEDLKITWTDDTSMTSSGLKSEKVQEQPKSISLFDSSLEDPLEISKAAKEIETLSNPPSIQQAPFKIPPLYPMTRFTCFVIVPKDTRLGSKVTITAKAPEGELKLEVPLEIDQLRGSMLHRLAAKKLITDIEERTSYLHDWYRRKPQNVTSASGVQQQFNELVEKTAIRLAKTFSLTSSYTSFIAIIANDPGNELKDKSKVSVVVPSINPLPHLSQPAPPKPVSYPMSYGAPCPFPPAPAPLIFTNTRSVSSSHPPPPPAVFAPPMCAPPPPAPAGFAPQMCAAPPPPSQPMFQQAQPLMMAESAAPGYGGMPGLPSSMPASYNTLQLSGIVGAPSVSLQSQAPPRSMAAAPSLRKKAMKRDESKSSDAYADFEEGSASGSPDLHQAFKQLLQHQNFIGSFIFSTLKSLLPSVASSLAKVTPKLTKFNPSLTSSSDKDLIQNIWATIVAMVYMEKKLDVIKEEWELVYTKAENWVTKNLSNGKPGDDVDEEVEKFVKELKVDAGAVVV